MICLLALAYQGRYHAFDWLWNIGSLLRRPFHWVTQWKKLPEANPSFSDLQAKYIQLLLENHYLQRFHELPKEKPSSFLPCKILLLYPQVVVDKGSSHGVKRGDGVIYENILLGIIVRPQLWESSVKPLLDKDMAVSVSPLQGPSFLIHADGKGYWEAKNIPQYFTLKEGMVLYTDGLDGLYPSGWAVGKISRIEKHKLFQSLQVEPLATFHQLTHLWIVHHASTGA